MAFVRIHETLLVNLDFIAYMDGTSDCAYIHFADGSRRELNHDETQAFIALLYKHKLITSVQFPCKETRRDKSSLL